MAAYSGWGAVHGTGAAYTRMALTLVVSGNFKKQLPLPPTADGGGKRKRTESGSSSGSHISAGSSYLTCNDYKDLDLYQTDKYDSDPNLHQSEKSDTDPDKNQGNVSTTLIIAAFNWSSGYNFSQFHCLDPDPHFKYKSGSEHSE